MTLVFRKLGTPLFYFLVFVAVISFFIFRLIANLRLPKTKLPKRILAKAALAFAITLVVFVTSTLLFWLALIKDLPSPDALATRSIDISTKIYDKNGVLLYNLYKDKNRTLVKLDDIPIHVRLATIAAEDSEFYNHPGISARGITRAIYKFFQQGKITGGSTITQQLVKNALLSPDKTMARKFREILIALAVEQKYTKDEILEMYLNEVSYGGTAYGVQEAARQYFDKNAKDLSLSEAALLAGLPKSPTLLSPFGLNPSLAFERQKEVLNLMKDAGFISDSQFERATSEQTNLSIKKTDIKAPHFVMYIKELLAKMYGEEFIYRNGLEVTTTLDMEIQDFAQKVVADEVSKLERLNVTNGAVLVLHPQTGEILAMVGSKDYFNEDDDGNVNVVLRPRQPGSSIKVVNYTYALAHGMTPATIIDDSPITFNVDGQPPYIPRNYDGKFRGRLTLRSALAESRNVPAVKVLNQMGVKNMIDQGHKMGITSWQNPNFYGLSLTLGGGEVALYELATVYATLANRGERPELFGISKITDASGKVLYEHKTASQPAVDPRVAFILTDILRDNTARTPAFGTHSALVVPEHREIAVKTGTSNDLRDNLTVGYNQNYLVAVWVGNNDNSPMSRIASGVTGASPIWNTIMTNLVADMSNHPWEIPEGLVQKKVCGREEWFLVENQPKIECNKNNTDKEDEQRKVEKRRER
ncbi:hypothetical protein A2803_00590 [Candidatus Woesebacteria bacterium RIFCSPHIGHO2_01_FULL_44_21]|uniref:Uncharacterized protein n=1 Tax=Candidatus Woesebacteria bacterium RIFCSPHIGHO2_01_FULL_44_21 TaxID=1802503 RepID=A0A1F7YWQ9_9BACT|nr:MAG: hypothetical protein A2803_00590 [Candidatus Woesebacteria bacterium RIFCSPHIGHO2_01_FULL_44_21]